MKIKNRKLKYFIYFIKIFSTSFGISIFISEFIITKMGNVFFWLLVLLVSMVLLYFDIYSPIWTHSQFIKRGEKYIDSFNEKRKALELYKQSLDKAGVSDKKRTESLFKIGSLYLEENDAVEAEKYFQNALSYQKDEKCRGDLLFQIGGVYFDNGIYSKATLYLDKALELGFKHISKIHIYRPALIKVINAYILDNKRNRAKEIYCVLLEKKAIKKNKEVEALL